MRRGLHTTLVYFGLVEDEAVRARLVEAPSRPRSVAVTAIVLGVLAAAAWGVVTLFGAGDGLRGLLVAEVVAALLTAAAALSPRVAALRVVVRLALCGVLGGLASFVLVLAGAGPLVTSLALLFCLMIVLDPESRAPGA